MADISSLSSSLELALSRSHPAEQREGAETLARSPLDLALDDGVLCGLCSAGTGVPLWGGCFSQGFWVFCHQPGAVQALPGPGGIYDAAFLILKSLDSLACGFLGDVSQDLSVKVTFINRSDEI